MSLFLEIIGFFSFVSLLSTFMLDFTDLNYKNNLEFNAICVYKNTVVGAICAMIVSIISKYIKQKFEINFLDW